MKRAKPDHENESGEHDRAAVGEAQGEQQTQRKDDKRKYDEQVPVTADTSQPLHDRAAAGLVCVVRQH